MSTFTPIPRGIWLALVFVACALVGAALFGCGGGEATAEEIAQHEADMAAGAAADAAARKTIQPVFCANGACK